MSDGVPWPTMVVVLPLQLSCMVLVVTLVVDSEPPGRIEVLVVPAEVEVVVATAMEVGYWAVKTLPARVRTLISTSPFPL
jgi:hypothetical protein